ncbi:MAG: ATP-dependent sacrificial sulfur transferase LarE [Phycisphaeraceae bacterium]|nr:ATP-dependent sacrificial sulfur transferase LarE [Phycisphaeraceae bacterium]
MSKTLDEKLAALRHWMIPWHSILTAYSGGVDSALVMAVAHEQLGPRALAAIGVSPSLPQRELAAAQALAEKLGAACQLIATAEVENPQYAANPQNRCFFCKTELFSRLAEVAKTQGYAVVLDGTNASDLTDDRPGRVAAANHGIRSPLLELGLTKDDVRQLSRQLGLPVWDKPAMACLASRVPHGSPISPQILNQIETAEDVLADLGFRQFRVRHHGELARVELPPEDHPRALELRQAITVGLKNAGFRHVCLDLAGFRSADAPPASPSTADRGQSPFVPLHIASHA